VNYYASVGPGILRALHLRPTTLERYPKGVHPGIKLATRSDRIGDAFYQKRAPASRPPWLEVATIRFPSGRTADEVVPRHPSDLAWLANLACLELHPHPVRATDLDHPDELRIDLDPTADVEWSQVRDVAAVVMEVLERHGMRGFPKTSGKRGLHVLVRIQTHWTHDRVRRAALALARDVERRVPRMATSKWWKEERQGVFIDYNQNAKDRTVAGAYSIRPTSDARVSTPLHWDEVATCDPAAFTMATVPARYADIGDPHAAIDERAYALDGLLELSEQQERDGEADAPWPPQYAKVEGEPLRAPPSRRKTPSARKA
jgi:DNA ligase D-like protein (predicted polymerase)